MSFTSQARRLRIIKNRDEFFMKLGFVAPFILFIVKFSILSPNTVWLYRRGKTFCLWSEEEKKVLINEDDSTMKAFSSSSFFPCLLGLGAGVFASNSLNY